MNHKRKIAALLLWIARIWAIIIVVIVVIFGGAELIGAISGAEDVSQIKTASDLILLFLMICTFIGLVIATIYRKLLGSLTTIFSVVGIYIIIPD